MVLTFNYGNSAFGGGGGEWVEREENPYSVVFLYS